MPTTKQLTKISYFTLIIPEIFVRLLRFDSAEFLTIRTRRKLNDARSSVGKQTSLTPYKIHVTSSTALYTQFTISIRTVHICNAHITPRQAVLNGQSKVSWYPNKTRVKRYSWSFRKMKNIWTAKVAREHVSTSTLDQSKETVHFLEMQAPERSVIQQFFRILTSSLLRLNRGDSRFMNIMWISFQQNTMLDQLL